jgi:hypothetical protein
MIEIVREHNLLNGYRFTIAEYGLVGAGLGLLAAYYGAAGRYLDALVWLGIVVNCAVIAILALDALRSGATDPGMLPMRRGSFRDSVAREHPRLARRTLVLITVGLLPYLLAGSVLIEWLRDRASASAPQDRRRSPRPMSGGRPRPDQPRLDA